MDVSVSTQMEEAEKQAYVDYLEKKIRQEAGVAGD